MSVVNRQAARAAQQEQAPSGNPFLKYDPVADIPNDQGQLTQGQPAIPGGGPQNQLAPEARAPLESPPTPETPQDPQIDDVRMAVALRKMMRERGMEGMGEGNFRSAYRSLQSFEQRYPGQMARYDMIQQQEVWKDEFLDRTPHPSSRLKRAQSEALNKQASLRYRSRDPGGVFSSPGSIKVPKTEDDLPKLEEGSRAWVLAQEEKAGLDTTSGITNIAEEFNLARKLNGSRTQFQATYAMAKDRLDNAGITLPKGMHPLNYNEDLGQLEALVPTDDGKVKRVLVDTEFLRLADLGKVGDIEELMAITGAVLSQLTPSSLGTTASIRLAQRHPAIAEAVGDFGWRNTGMLLEYFLDSDAGIEDLAEALDGNFLESAIGTTIGRVTGRWFGGNNPDRADILSDINQYTKGVRYPEHLSNPSDPTQWYGRFKVRNEVLNDAARAAQDSINATLKESAQTLEDLQKLTDGPFEVDRGSVSGSLDEIATQKGREARLSSREQTQLDVRRKANKDSLNQAIDNVHTNNMPTNPARDPGNTVATIVEEAETHAGRLTDIDHSVIKSEGLTGPGSGIEIHEFRFNQGSQVTRPPKRRGEVVGEWPHGSGAKVTVDHDAKAVVVNWIGADEALPGSGATLVDNILTTVLNEKTLPPGYRILADDNMSRYSVQMIQRMAKQEGFTIQMNPTHEVIEKGVKYYRANTAGTGVFEVTELPGYTVHMPVVGDLASYEKGRMASVLDTDLEYAAQKTADANFWGVKQAAQIGWQEERQKSLYSVVNKGRGKDSLDFMARKLQARITRALTGSDQSQADSLLKKLFIQSADEDGEAVISGLTNETLDLGQLLRSRDTLQGIYEKSADPEIKGIVDTIDNLLYNGALVDARGVAVDAQVATGIRATMDHTRKATELMREVESSITSNALFRQNDLGDFVGTDLKTLETALSNGSRFWTHLSPWMSGNKKARSVMGEALGSIYQKNVLDKGWTMARHRAFFERFGHAADEVWGQQRALELRNTRFSTSGRNPIKEAAEQAVSRANRLDRYGPVNPGSFVKDFTRMANQAIDNQANKIVQQPGARMTDSQVQIGAGRVRQYLRELDNINPELSSQVRADSLRETQLLIKDNFFVKDINANPLDKVENFGKYINDNEPTLTALHGGQYVKDLRTIQQAMQLDANRFKMSGAVPELQGDVVRVSRTLMGPLSVFQRRVSAANWLRLRWSANKAMDLLSDPAALRELNSYAGFDMRSRPVVAFLARTGIIPGTGWDGKGEMPRDVYEKGLEFAGWLEEMQQELMSSEKVEPTQ